MLISVVIITFNEEANIGRALASVQPLVAGEKGEIIVVDSGSTDRTVEIAKSYGAKVFVEEWKGFAAQKNSAIDKAAGEWILSLDADEELDSQLQQILKDTLQGLTRWADLRRRAAILPPDQQCANSLSADDVSSDVEYHLGCKFDENFTGLWLPRRNYFLNRPMKHGGFWPDPKLRFFRAGHGKFENRRVHEDLKVSGNTGTIRYGVLIHHSYPTLSDYIEHMNRYSSLGAEMVVTQGKVRFSFINIALRPLFTFIYNYFFRLGFLDGREGLLLHLYHAVYVSWKYAKAWELSRKRN
jgi:glycosyltransferase involved in cell wall biosynthesis